jgi:hypothetical protein
MLQTLGSKVFPDQTKKDLSHDKHVYPNMTLPMTKLGLHKKNKSGQHVISQVLIETLCNFRHVIVRKFENKCSNSKSIYLVSYSVFQDYFQVPDVDVFYKFKAQL